MLYQHPLSYLLGLQGVALLRAWGGHHDRAFTHARFAEMRELLADMEKWGDGASAPLMPSEDVYAGWADSYDEPGNAMIDIEQPVVRRMLDRAAPGLALDAACGTARHGAYLAERGHTVIGVDRSPDMLDVARRKLPEARFHRADLTELPVPDNHVDLVVCALALCHVDDIDPVFAEFARVLKPGGRLVVSDTRGMLDRFDHPLVKRQADGSFSYALNRHRSAADYLTAALPLGFEVLDCAEPRRPDPYVDDDGVPPGADGPAPHPDPAAMPNVWALHRFAVEATNAAWRDTPTVIVWEFRLRPEPLPDR